MQGQMQHPWEICICTFLGGRGSCKAKATIGGSGGIWSPGRVGRLPGMSAQSPWAEHYCCVCCSRDQCTRCQRLSCTVCGGDRDRPGLCSTTSSMQRQWQWKGRVLSLISPVPERSVNLKVLPMIWNQLVEIWRLCKIRLQTPADFFP